MKIEDYIGKNFSFESFNLQKKKNFNDIKNYYQNAKADSIHCYKTISKYLSKDQKILEVGGGIHLLTNYLNEEYDITSLEPGGFTEYTDDLRKQILSRKKINAFTTTLENFYTNDKYDFIFSMNVLEHTKDIKSHIKNCLKLLKDENSILFIQCPNYTFPYEAHFYEFFIPFCPKFTFEKLKKKKLIKKLGEKKFYNTLNFLNFDCTYRNIKKMDLNIDFKHPVEEIFLRIKKDKQFKNRILQHFFIRMIYKFIIFLKIEKIIFKLYPMSISPYMIFTIKI